ncbi:MGMT family protein [Peristeroidobacter soli]|uniref:MGMT family protein n=1 Tax=Peristeroidobacter soli TaxID=2497877 RepID=UPI001C37BB1B|nr:MGMT family protein [Peristeroidobacter soli]
MAATARKKKTSKKKSAARKSVPKRGAVAPASDAARIIAAIKKIPRGKVCTYGGVADVAGLPRRARLVGTVLRQTPASRGVPWFRVINASGRISFPAGSDGYARQRKHLENEGVDFVGGRVNLDVYGWPPHEKMLDELLWGPA